MRALKIAALTGLLISCGTEHEKQYVPICTIGFEKVGVVVTNENKVSFLYQSQRPFECKEIALRFAAERFRVVAGGRMVAKLMSSAKLGIFSADLTTSSFLPSNNLIETGTVSGSGAWQATIESDLSAGNERVWRYENKEIVSGIRLPDEAVFRVLLEGLSLDSEPETITLFVEKEI